MAFPLSRVSLCYFCLVLTCFLSFQPICVPGVRVFSCFRFQRFSWNVSALLLLACVSFVFSLFQRICVAGVRMLCLSYPYPVRWSGIALCAGSLCTTLRCSMSVFGAPLSFYVHQPTIGNPAPFSSFFSSKRSCPVQRSQKKQKRPWHAWNIKGGGQALRLFCECSSNARLKITIETRKNWAGHQHRSDAPCSHHYLLNVLYGDRFFGHVSWWWRIGRRNWYRSSPCVSRTLVYTNFYLDQEGQILELAPKLSPNIVLFCFSWISRQDRVGFPNCLDLHMCFQFFEVLICSRLTRFDFRKLYPLFGWSSPCVLVVFFFTTDLVSLKIGGRIGTDASVWWMSMGRKNGLMWRTHTT